MTQTEEVAEQVARLARLVAFIQGPLLAERRPDGLDLARVALGAKRDEAEATVDLIYYLPTYDREDALRVYIARLIDLALGHGLALTTQDHAVWDMGRGVHVDIACRLTVLG